jgi:GxxExxY protein
MPKSKGVIHGESWLPLTYQIIGQAMEVHNTLGPGHREAVYHEAMAARLRAADLFFEDERYIPIVQEDGQRLGGYSPDFVVAETVIVELKARSHTITKDDQAQVIGYFAALPQCAVALFINFGRYRLEFHRLLPPKSVQAFRREKWSK